MRPGGGMIEAMPTAGQALSSVIRGVQWGLDRMVSVGYGVVYDYIVERFRPYQELHDDVLRLVDDRPHAEVSDQRIGQYPGELVGVAARSSQAAQTRVLELVAGHDQGLAPGVHCATVGAGPGRPWSAPPSAPTSRP